MIIVTDWLQSWLRTQPEYGMGYQKVVAKLSDGSNEKGFILNSEVFLTDSENKFQSPLFYNDWQLVVSEVKKSPLYISNATLVPRPPETLTAVLRVTATNAQSFSLSERQLLQAKSAGSGAKDAPITITASGEIFKRFSAYADDRRITPKKGLSAGTFATTREDADAHVKTGTDAVSRYALENKKPASNVFTIKPPSDTSLKRGIVEPAYGEVGGGIEVIFVYGTGDGTVTGPDVIPDR